MKAIDYKIKGIKCDNPSCDYKDETAKLEDYQLWLNKPCPKCGQNLLTEKDFEAVKNLINLVKIINWIMKPFMFLFTKKKTKVSVEMDGTGKVDFKEIE